MAEGLGRVVGAGVIAVRKKVSWYPKRRPVAASRTLPVKYHHSVLYPSWRPWSRGKDQSRGSVTCLYCESARAGMVVSARIRLNNPRDAREKGAREGAMARRKTRRGF